MKRKNSTNSTNTNEDEDPNEDLHSSESFQCKYCKYITLDLDQLDEHITSTHLFEEAQEAEASPNFSIKSEIPDNPSYAIIDAEESDPENEVYVCHICSYETPKRKVMRKHLLKHEQEPCEVIYKCSECTYETKRKCDMPKHLISHCSNVEMYQCPECPYATKRKNDLPKHLLCHKKHNEIELYQCDICNYHSKRKGDLRKHILTHSAEKGMYCCTECRYASIRQNDLYKHVLVHSTKDSSGLFKCLKCDYVTDKTTKFAKHVLSNCELCDNTEGYTDEYIIVEGAVQELDKNLITVEYVGECEENTDDFERLQYRQIENSESGPEGNTETQNIVKSEVPEESNNFYSHDSEPTQSVKRSYRRRYSDQHVNKKLKTVSD